MHVPSNTRDSQRPPRRLPVAAVLTLLLASFGGNAQAVEFDEKLEVPMVKDTAALHSQAQSYMAQFSALRSAGPQELIRNRALHAQRVELQWQIQEAIDAHRPLGDLSALGLEPNDDGGYRIDFNAAPQWNPPGELLAAWLPQTNWEIFGAQLIERGFRAEDVTRLREYVTAHDARKQSLQQSLPLAVSFSKIVKKYDRLNRPLGDRMVLSYLYQRARLDAEAKRAWTERLLNTLDDKRGRILLAYVAEMRSTGVWAPSDQHTGIAELLSVMRLSDFEQRAMAEATGGAP
jgi:hypothetical protein